METKNENLSKIKKYSDLYKRNRITFDEYVVLIGKCLEQLNENNKFTKILVR